MFDNVIFSVLLTLNVRLSSSYFAKRSDKLEVIQYVGLDEYAHTVFLHFPNKVDSTNGLYCGGSLLLAQVIVTTAECLDEVKVKKNDILAYFGSSSPSEARDIQRVSDYKVHPKYEEDNVFYNLGLAFVDKPPPLGPYIKKILLPVGIMRRKIIENPSSEETTTPYPEWVVVRNKPSSAFEDQDAYMAVWAGAGKGPTDLRRSVDTTKNRILRGYKVVLLSSEECNRRLSNIQTSQHTICSPSNYDGNIIENVGSGLIIKKPMPQLIGVFSRMVQGVSVFVNVDSHRGWLREASRQLYRRTCYRGQPTYLKCELGVKSANCSVVPI